MSKVNDSSLRALQDATRVVDEREFRRRLQRATVGLVLALGLPMLMLIGLVMFLLNSAKLVDHTDQVISRVNGVEKLLATMQSSFRGFRLTNEEQFLGPYQAADGQIDARLESLASAVSDNPAQLAALRQTRDKIDAWRAFVAGELAAVRAGSKSAADPAFLRSGGPMFDEIGRRFEAFIAVENGLRATRSDRLNAVVTTLFLALGVGGLVGIPALARWLRGLLRGINVSYRESVAVADKRAGELEVTLSSIGDAVVATDARGRVTFLNPVAESLTGWTSEDARGRELTDVFDISNEQTGERAENPVARVLRENAVVGLANHTVLRARDGTLIPIADSAAPIRNEDGEVLGVILVFHDVSEKHAAEKILHANERRFRFLNDLGEATRLLADPESIMTVSARLLGMHLGASRCAYADVEADSEQFTIRHDYTNDCASTVGTYGLSAFGPRAVANMHGGRTLVVRDVGAELADDEGEAMFKAIGIQAIVCCPLVKEGGLRAMMAVHQTTPRAWSVEEIALVEEVTERCWATIERARAEAESRERARISELRADVAGRLDAGVPLERTLQGCCELLVSYLDAAFARIWTLDPAASALELRASAGIYTHLDGPHARVPVGEFKIGRIAQSRRAHLTNDVPHDPNVSDPEWARREGMVAFAGYPLVVGDEVLGVLAVFARHPLSPATLRDLEPIAAKVALHLERRRAETALRAATEKAELGALAAAESAERFRLLAEVVSLQVWTAQPDGALDFANQECVHYLGGDAERDILGHAWAKHVHPEDIGAALQRWQASLASGERYQMEFRLRGVKNEEYRWFLVRAEAMRGADGRIAKWFGTNTDIHELKLAQDAAERASRAKDAFLATLSHELRTPLTPVLMTAAFLREDARLPADVREQLGMMERNIALEARLIDDLLDLTSIARGKLQLRSQPCDAHSLIGLALEIVRDDAFAKGIAVERDFAAARSGLVADPARFQQVVWNLLRNAVKFTPRGGRITIRTCNVGTDFLHIEITDSGIGITPAALEQIFLPFDQGGLVGDHRYGGMGLGLSIARAIVDLHGGEISARSAGSGQGATFFVDLPGAIDAPAGMIEESRIPSPSSDATDRIDNALRLLLVEDHEASREVLARLLVSQGHAVTAVASVAEARTVADAKSFDLVISDLGLPDGTGNELMEGLRDTHGLRGIALTGYGMEEDVQRSLESGFVTHLVKPVNFDDLCRALKNLA